MAWTRVWERKLINGSDKKNLVRGISASGKDGLMETRFTSLPEKTLPKYMK